MTEDEIYAKMLWRKVYLQYGSELVYWGIIDNNYNYRVISEEIGLKHGWLELYDSDKVKLEIYKSDKVKFIKVNESVMEE